MEGDVLVPVRAGMNNAVSSIRAPIYPNSVTWGQATSEMASCPRASRLVVLCQLRFLLVLVSVSGLVGVLINMTSGFNTRDLTLLCAYSILGMALLAALVLVAVDRVRVALLGFLLAGGAIAVGVGVLQATGLPMSVEGGYLAGCLILLSALTALAVRTLRDPRALA